jgi:uncharacterized membrane protein
MDTATAHPRTEPTTDEPAVELLRRSFVVDLPLGRAWDCLADVTTWPTWAHHIRSVEVSPPGPLTPSTEGVLRLAGGLRSRFAVTSYEPGVRWEWQGRVALITVHYDHRFEAIDDERTRLVWVVRASGPGRRTLGRAFAAVYRRNLDRAIPRLQAACHSDVPM